VRPNAHQVLDTHADNSNKHVLYINVNNTQNPRETKKRAMLYCTHAYVMHSVVS